MSGILTLLSGAIAPVATLIDSLHTSEEERLQVKAGLFKVQSELAGKLADYESQLLASKADLIRAEAQGASWLQRNWRPVSMLTFLALVVLDSFGLLAFRLAAEAWTLLQIGLGGYVIGRTAEKVIPKVTEAMRRD